jgi:hypothetical protein
MAIVGQEPAEKTTLEAAGTTVRYYNRAGGRYCHVGKDFMRRTGLTDVAPTIHCRYA